MKKALLFVFVLIAIAGRIEQTASAGEPNYEDQYDRYEQLR